MQRRSVTIPVFVTASMFAIGIALAAQDPFAMKSPNGISMDIFHEINDIDGVGTCLMNLGVTALHGGDAGGASEYYEQSLAIARQLGDRWREAATLMNLAECRRELAQCASGLELCDAAAAIYAALEDQRSTARVWHLSALILSDRGEHERARGLFEKCIVEFVRVGDETDLCDAHAGLAYASGEHDPRRAATLWGAVKRSRTTRRVSTPYFETGRESRQIASARAALDDDREFALSWQRGYEMALHDAVHIAIDE